MDHQSVSGQIPPVGLASGAIDVGPFLRQEGRNPTWTASAHSLRGEVISRIRQELGLHSEQAQRVPRPRSRPPRDFSLWAAFKNKLRHPG
jgi:hypothetical protein